MKISWIHPTKPMAILLLSLVLVIGLVLAFVNFGKATALTVSPSDFCHETDGAFTDCDPGVAGIEEWSDVPFEFFPVTQSRLYADQADLDPELATPDSPVDTFMLMYDECGRTEPLAGR